MAVPVETAAAAGPPMRPRSAYIRRLRNGADGSESEGTLHDAAHLPPAYRRRAHYGERFEAARERVGYTSADEAEIDGTRDLARAVVVFPLRSDDARGDANRELAPAAATIREWLAILVDGQIERASGEQVARLVVACARPSRAGERAVKAHVIVGLFEAYYDALLAALGSSLSDPASVTRTARAWRKRIAMHIDLVLAMYSSVERGSNWY